MVASNVSGEKKSSRPIERIRARMLGVNHQVWRHVTDSDSDSSSWTTDDEADVITYTAAAAAAAGTTTTFVKPPPTSNTTVAKLLSCLLVVPLLVLTPFLLHRCADRPLAAVSTVSLAVSSCLFLVIASISSGTTMTVSTVFQHVSHLPLLAFATTRLLLSPFTGMAFLYLNTILTAGLCGFVLAERRHRDGVETSADAAIKISGGELHPGVPAVSASLVSLPCAARALWMCFRFGPGDAVAAVFEFSFMAIACLFSWTLFVHGCLLRGALFSGQTLGMLGLGGLMFLYTTVFALALLFGIAVAAIVPWVTAMATAGLLGYTLAVYQQYKRLRLARQQRSSYM